ncbi:MAG: UDP-N-acetylmuramate dehydrogenase [Candidatus Saccharimonadales bacterium]
MRLGGNAAFLTDVNTRSEVQEAVSWATEHQLPVIMIGGGSNIFWRDEGFNGLVIVNKILGITETGATDSSTYITAKSGENWDSFVNYTVQAGLSGLEQLSLIPGTVGATPIQNVGAYGQEVSNVIVTIEAFDTQQKQFVTLKGSECQFSYRSSRFKSIDKNRYFITGVTYFLSKSPPLPPYYDSITEHINAHQINVVTAQVIRDAVISIRSAKLPDPNFIANNGSFFSNPIVTNSIFFELKDMYPNIRYWHVDNDQVKLSAAWLIEQTGFKGIHDEQTGIAVWEKQSLVLINEHAEKTENLLLFKQKIVDAVKDKFGIELIQEPELLPS